jgi:hypothetical protein
MKKWVLSLFGLLLISALTAQINFSSTGLQGLSLSNPTSLDFGPDDRLYVSAQTGEIYAYTVNRQSNGNYTVSNTETILAIKKIQNHNDDGSLHATVKRQITGITVVGTPQQPVLYVSSSDYRIGGGGGGSDSDLDVNSGIISRLTWDGTQWIKEDLVRGLPRSEENHSTNGLQYDSLNHMLYVAQGGNTNAGAPSNNFAFLCETALSAAILTVDLNAIDALPLKYDTVTGDYYRYDLPTVDDPTRPNVNGITDPNQAGYTGQDQGDPFGGNDGLNQARWEVGSPVQVYAGGFRNVYDLVLTEDRKLYTWDNGANANWGGHPANEGVGTATNDWVPGEPGSTGPGPNDAQVNNKDGLHYVTGPGYYGGHPTPIRANPSGAGLFTHDHANGSGGSNGVWRTSFTGNTATSLPADWPPVDPALARPIEGDFQNAGVDDPSLYTVTSSTNGITEYTASNFNGILKGNLLAASFNGNIYRVDRNDTGSIDGPGDVTIFANGFGAVPLDVTTLGDNSPFPGTVWAATYGSNAITIFEPQDYVACDGNYDTSLDEDGDGYTNADELDNNGNPCNASSVPPDNDGTLINGFKVSDLNDPDDDDDGLLDSADALALDGSNGQNLSLPFDYPLLNGDPGFGLYGLGFTGFTTNKEDDYLTLFKNEENSSVELIAGGAVGLLSINDVPAGSMQAGRNDLKNGFQFGFSLNKQTPPFALEAKMLGPVFQGSASGQMFNGVQLGDGSQSNYISLLVHANAGQPELRLVTEINDNATIQNFILPDLATAAELSLTLEVNMLDSTFRPMADAGNGAVALSGAQSIPPALYQHFASSAAVYGVVAGRDSTDSLFNATWDNLEGYYLPNGATGNWTYLNDGSNCQPLGSAGSCPQGRHEAAYVKVGDRFVLLGGREHGSNVNLYDPAIDTWTQGAAPGFSLHHFQAVAHEGLVYVLGAFTGNFPDEDPVPQIYVYDPQGDQWHEGPTIPAARRRGSAAAVLHEGQFYLLGGLTNGHQSGWVPWLDRFDPATNTWTALPDAPHSRDHFHAVSQGHKLYAAAGRNTGKTSVFADVIRAVDVYDFDQQSWTTLSDSLPTGRAGNAAALLGNELLIIGGESTQPNAQNETEALDLSQGTWRNLAPLQKGRHGSQAIVHQGAVYLASGSGSQGAGQLPSQEVFTFGPQAQTPALQAIPRGSLALSDTLLDFSQTASGDTAWKSLYISHDQGQQAVLIDSALLNAAGGNWQWRTPYGLPYHLSPGDSLEVELQYIATTAGDASLSFPNSSAGTPSVVLKGKAQTGEGLYINAGGGNYTASSGTVFSADQYYLGGSTFTSNQAIANTADPSLYQTERWAANLTYEIPVEPGKTYQVTLYLAEIYGGAQQTGARVFDVFLEGQKVRENLDIYDTVGGYSALQLSFQTPVNDSVLNLEMIASQNNAKLAALAVEPLLNANGPVLAAQPGQHYFQNTPVTDTNQFQFTLQNTGTAQAQIDSFQISGPQAGDFYTDLSTGTTILSGYNTSFTAFFGPQNQNPVVRDATLELFYNGSNSPLVVALGGEAGCPAAGTPCDDGDSTTINDVEDGNCQCAGTPAPVSPAVEIFINAGGPSYTAANGDNYLADQYYLNGSKSSTSQTINGTADQVLYQTSRWNSILEYAIPVPRADTFLVTLEWSENWNGAFAVGQRVFDVAAEGQTQLENIDIFKEVGANTATSKSFQVAVTDGTLDLYMTASANNPTVNAIRVESMGAVDSTAKVNLSPAQLSLSGSAQNPDSAQFTLSNAGLLPDTLQQLQWQNQGNFSTNLGVGTVVPASSSQDYQLYANLGNAGTSQATRLKLYWASGDSLVLDANATAQCPAAGTPCDDGDSTTVNDVEDGNCQCAGTAPTPSNPGTQILINAGGPAYTAANGDQYQEDQYYLNGSPSSTGQTISGTVDQPLYQTSRWNYTLEYAIPVPQVDTFLVTLEFSENWNGAFASGKRVFDVAAEGKTQVENIDIYQEVGSYTATTKSFQVLVSDGTLDLYMTASANNPTVNAIRVESMEAMDRSAQVSLSPGQLSLSGQEQTTDSAPFTLVNNGLQADTLQQIQWQNQGNFSTNLTAGTPLPSGSSQSYQLMANLGAAGTSQSTKLKLFLTSGDSLVLDANATALCPAAGTPCDDGDSTTVNDVEDGNCQCAGKPSGTAAPNGIYINCGGGSYTSQAGAQFSPDQYSVGGSLGNYSGPVANTQDDSLFFSSRWGKNMSYYVPLSQNGTYLVKIYLAETWSGAYKVGKRVFDIRLENNLSFDDVDIFQAVGAETALILTDTVQVNDGELALQTEASSNNSAINALAIIPLNTYPAKRGNEPRRSAQEWAAYPNPLQGHRQWMLEPKRSPETTWHWRLLNMHGQLIREGSLTGKTALPAQDLPAGSYLLELKAGQTIQRLRLLRQ